MNGKKTSGKRFSKIWVYLACLSSFLEILENGKRETRYFHVVASCMTTKKCTKKRDARAKLLFCLINLFLFTRSRRSC